MARLKEVLEKKSDKLCAKLDEVRRRCLSLIKESAEHDDSTDPIDAQSDVDQVVGAPSSSQRYQALFCPLFPVLAKETLTDLVIADLESPAECVIDDLTELAGQSFLVGDSEHDEAFRGFVRSAIMACAQSHRSEPFAVGEGPFFVGPDPYWMEEINDFGFEPFTLWERGDFKVEVIGALATRGEGLRVDDTDAVLVLHHNRLFVTTSCRGSRRSAEAFTEKIKDLLPSLIKSSLLLNPPNPLDLEDEHAALPPIVPIIDSQKKLGEAFLILPECLDAVLLKLDKPKKDTLDRRIRNAILLLAESDRQMSQGISVALAVAAIEALVGQKTAELSSFISDNVATLLEPCTENRGLAVSFVRKLYDQRSSILHGSQVEAERQVCEHARLLAAAVLKALIERRGLMRRAGMPTESPEQLLQELRGAKYKPGQPTGVTDSRVSHLWRQGQGKVPE